MKTKSLTEGAMLAAITVLMVYLGVHIGLVGLIIPVPLALLVYRHGLRAGIIVSLTSSMVSALALNSVFLALELIIIGVLGIAIGMALREKFTISQTFLVGIGADIISTILKVFSYSLIFGRNLIEMYLELWEESSGYWVEIWQQLNLPPEVIAEYQQMIETIPMALQMLLPALLLGMAVVRAWANLWVLRLILKRLGDNIPWFPRFIHWRFPAYFFWGFILGRVAMLISAFIPWEIWERLALNLDVIFLYTFLIQGLAVIWFYFDKYKVAKVLRVIFVIFMFQPGTLIVLLFSIVGVLDVWFDFRRLKAINDMEG